MDEETKASIRTLLSMIQRAEELFSGLSDKVLILSDRIDGLEATADRLMDRGGHLEYELDRLDDRVWELERG